MSSLGNCFKSARGAGILTSIISLVLITAFSSPAVSQVSDTEYSLLLKRLMKASCHSKYLIEDSLMSVENPDLDLMDRLYASEEYAQINEPGYYEDLWLEKFIDADSKSKIAIIDSMVTDFHANSALLSDILLTTKYADDIDYPGGYAAYQAQIALKIAGSRPPNRRYMLYRYYYEGENSRKLSRPISYDFKFDSQKIVCEVKDSWGDNWGITYTGWYPDCFYDFWLVKKNRHSDFWRGPLYTGIRGPIQAGDSVSYLRLFSNLPYLYDIEEETYQLVSPSYLLKDYDRDGLYDVEEIAFGTNPKIADTDGDKIIDGEDINPLARGAYGLGRVAQATRSLLKLICSQDNPINIYILSGFVIPDIEYYSNSNNAIFLPEAKRDGRSRCPSELMGGIPIEIGIRMDGDTLIALSANMLGKEEIYYIKELGGYWIVISKETEE